MKKNKLFIALVVIVAGGYLMYGQESNKAAPSLALQNIEALANNEYEIDYFCYETGSVVCPNGNHVKYYLDNLKLD